MNTDGKRSDKTIRRPILHPWPESRGESLSRLICVYLCSSVAILLFSAARMASGMGRLNPARFLSGRSHPMPRDRIHRRDFLNRSGAAFAGFGLGLSARLALAAELGGGHPLAPRPGHFPAQAKNLIV